MPGDERRRFGKDGETGGQVAIFGKAPVIAAAEFQPVAFRDADIGQGEPRRCAAIGADCEAGQRQDARAEQFEICAGEANARVGGVVHDTIGGNAPARRLVAAFLVDDGAGGIGCLFEHDGAIRTAQTLARGQSSALGKAQQQFPHRARLEFVGQREAVADQLVPVGIDQPDPTFRLNFAGVSVPQDAIGAQRAVVVPKHHVARRGDRVGGVVVLQDIGFESDLRTGLDDGNVAVQSIRRGGHGLTFDRRSGFVEGRVRPGLRVLRLLLSGRNTGRNPFLSRQGGKRGQQGA